MKDAYFPHDINARNDPKMPALKLKYKSSGIGMYWIFVEILREQENFKYLIDNDIIWESLAGEFMTTPEEAQQFMGDCIQKYKLFKTDGEYIWSDSLVKRMQKMVDSRTKRSDAGKKGMESRWGKKPSEDNNVITTLYQTANSDITNDNKEEKSKEEKSKENINISSNEDIVSETDRVPYRDIVNLYHSICTTLPRIKDITGNRQNTVRVLWKQTNNLDYFKELFQKTHDSDFLSGRNGNWMNCCFDWIIKPANRKKIMEGNYINKEKTANW